MNCKLINAFVQKRIVYSTYLARTWWHDPLTVIFQKKRGIGSCETMKEYFLGLHVFYASTQNY